MTRRKPQEIAPVEGLAFDEGADVRVDQGTKRFERIEYKTMTVEFIVVKEPDCETSTGGGKKRAETPSLASIGKVQHGVDWVRGVTGAGCADPTCTASEGACEPRRKGPAGAGHQNASPDQEAQLSELPVASMPRIVSSERT